MAKLRQGETRQCDFLLNDTDMVTLEYRCVFPQLSKTREDPGAEVELELVSVTTDDNEDIEDRLGPDVKERMLERCYEDAAELSEPRPRDDLDEDGW